MEIIIMNTRNNKKAQQVACTDMELQRQDNTGRSTAPLVVQRLEVSIIQIPNAGNDQTAVCSATLELAGGMVLQDVAMASASDIKEGMPGTPIDVASATCKNIVLANAVLLAGAQAPPGYDRGDNEPTGEHSGFLPNSINFIAQDTCDNIIETTAVPQEGTSPDSFNGGGTKPASEKQLSFLCSLAQNEGKDPDKLARKAFGKSVQELQGQEADTLIKGLKK